MTEAIFDHNRLDVYRLSIDYVALSFSDTKDLNGCHRHARDQWLHAAQSIPLTIVEGNGKRSLKDRSRFLAIARIEFVVETQAEYNAGVEYEYCDAEYEYKYDRDKPEQFRG